MRVFRVLRAGAAGLALLVVIAAACGGGNDDGQGGSGGGSEPTAKSSGGRQAAIEPCKLLTKEEVEAALGEPGDAGDADSSAVIGMSLCTWGAASDTSLSILQVSVLRTGDMPEQLRKQGGAKAIYNQTKAGYTGLQAVSGIGDEAYRHDRAIEVLKGDVWVTADLSFGGPPDRRKETETQVLVELARKVLERVK